MRIWQFESVNDRKSTATSDFLRPRLDDSILTVPSTDCSFKSRRQEAIRSPALDSNATPIAPNISIDLANDSMLQKN